VASDLGPVGAVDGAGWRTVLGLTSAEAPVAVIVEGTWWRGERTRARLGMLDDVRELGVPDVFLGSVLGRHVIYACPYGAPRTAEVVHIAVRVGAALAIQLGSCGVLQDEVRPGDVVVPEHALGLDGVTPHYAADPLARASGTWVEHAATALAARHVDVHQGPSVTWPTLFSQPLERVRAWQAEGYLGVDMESATTFAVAARFGAAAVSMLVAWDEVLAERSFLDPLAPHEAVSFERSEGLIYDVALELVARVGGGAGARA
jgi:uridine phosphorylase